MKVRAGFVGNSSSSSFILVGKRISPKNVTLNFASKIVILGDSLYEGTDVIRLSPDMVELAKELLPYEYWIEVYGELDFGDKLDETMVGCEVFSLDADDHSTSSLEELKERYGGGR